MESCPRCGSNEHVVEFPEQQLRELESLQLFFEWADAREKPPIPPVYFCKACREFF